MLAKGLLHLGNRAAVDQALSRLVRRGALRRAGRGVYVLPVESRFGRRAPSVENTVQGVAAALGERIANSGAMAANELGLTTQVPEKRVFLTSGPNRVLPDWTATVGGGHGIAFDPVEGSFMGGADPRRDGYAMGV